MLASAWQGKFLLIVALAGLVVCHLGLTRGFRSAGAGRTVPPAYTGFLFVVAEVGTVCALVLALGFSPMLRIDLALLALLFYLTALLCSLIRLNAIKKCNYARYCHRFGNMVRAGVGVVALAGVLQSEVLVSLTIAGRSLVDGELFVAAVGFASVSISLRRAFMCGARLAVADPAPARTAGIGHPLRETADTVAPATVEVGSRRSEDHGAASAHG